jgi:hypothetical protein
VLQAEGQAGAMAFNVAAKPDEARPHGFDYLSYMFSTAHGRIDGYFPVFLENLSNMIDRF